MWEKFNIKIELFSDGRRYFTLWTKRSPLIIFFWQLCILWESLNFWIFALIARGSHRQACILTPRVAKILQARLSNREARCQAKNIATRFFFCFKVIGKRLVTQKRSYAGVCFPIDNLELLVKLYPKIFCCARHGNASPSMKCRAIKAKNQGY